MIGIGCCNEDIANGCAARLKAARCANADHQVWFELVHSQVGCDGCWDCSHIVYTMQLAFPCK